jgi:predicted metal-binding membrane protein
VASPAARTAPRRASTATLAAVVLAVALACWIVALRQMRGMDMGPGTNLGSFSFFLGVWVTMMAAMMLPSALPMVLLFDRVSRERRAAGMGAPATGLFVLSYLLVWTGYGVGAYLVYRGIRSAGLGFLSWDRHGPLVAGGAIAAAGLYELTPLKSLCLRHCRSPLHFVLGGWKPGARGAVAMGVQHGGYCVGCCWGLMVVLFAVGVMSVAWMAVVAAVIFAQKVLPLGERSRLVLPLVLVGLGAWVALASGSVPGLTPPM